MIIESSAPGRICLFGEHQDYMSLSVINAAIDLRITVRGSAAAGGTIRLKLPDLGTEVCFDARNIRYEGSKDYIRSVVKVLRKKGLIGEPGVDAVLSGNIPMKAGTSSSSALSVAWAGFLLGTAFPSEEIGRMRMEVAGAAFSAEVEEFNESGGMQDQYASALGGVNYFTFFDGIGVESLRPLPGGFVLGDSGEPKDTQKTLRRIRNGQEAGLRELSAYYPFRHNAEIDPEKASGYFGRVSLPVRPYLEAVLENHDITKKALEELKRDPVSNDRIAGLMNRHHEILRDKLKISTEKIEKMIGASLKAGALSAKINGSGEGGCMFAYCPGREDAVADAIAGAGGRPHIIRISRGLEVRITDGEFHPDED